MAKLKIGLIQLVTLSPELNQTAISESLCQRVSVIKTAKNIVKDNIIGKNLTKLKPNKVLIESAGKTPRPANCTK